MVFAEIPLLTDDHAAKQKADNQTDFYCLLSTLYGNSEVNPYRYSSVWLHYPKGITDRIDREEPEAVWMSVVIGDLDASGIKGVSKYRGDGVVRMARCLVPDLPEAQKMIQEKIVEFSSDSWVGNSKLSMVKRFNQSNSSICVERWVTEVCRSTAGILYDCTITEDRCVEYDYGDTWPENDWELDDDAGGTGGGGGYPDPDADDGCDEYGDPCITSGSLPVECAEGGDEEDLDPGMNKTIADDMILYSASGNMTLDSTCSDEEEEEDELQKWEDEKIIDDELVPCMQTIVEDLKGVEEGVGEIIQKFAGETPGYNWELKSGSLGGSNAQTSQQYNSSTGTVTTTFDPQRFTNATDLSLARTILHEAVHAYILAHFRVDPIEANKTYSELVNDLKYQRYPDQNSLQHAEFVRNFIYDISIALKGFGINKGYNLNNQYYSDLAWGGLTDWPKRDLEGNIVRDSNGNPIYEETPWFKEEYPDTSDRNRVKNNILTEQGLININNQKGSDAGC